MIIPFAPRTLPVVTSLAAALGGAIVAWHYHQLGLTLTHYDARGHLVVARRIIDSITPGWQQVGAIWLPLPHLLNAIPVQIDLFYRTGASGVAISIAAYAIATGAISWIVLSLTESAAAAAAGAAVFALNPNVLYLQSTPMTEPLLLATTTVAVAMLIAWCQAALKGCATTDTVADDRSAGLQACHVGPASAGPGEVRLKADATAIFSHALRVYDPDGSGRSRGGFARAARGTRGLPAAGVVGIVGGIARRFRVDRLFHVAARDHRIGDA